MQQHLLDNFSEYVPLGIMRRNMIGEMPSIMFVIDFHAARSQLFDNLTELNQKNF